MKVRPNLKPIFDRFNSEYFDGILSSSIRLTWSPRLRVTAGRCIWGNTRVPIEIQISDPLMAAHNYPVDEIERTMLHEMCHAWCIVRHKEYGHGRWFQWKMTTMTGENINHTCHHMDVSTTRNDRKYELYCSTCDKVVHTMAKPPKVAYVCRLCRTRLTVLNTQPETSIKIFG